MDYEDVFKKIGKFGRYQMFIYVLQTLPVVFTAIQTYLSVFILYVPDHRCVRPRINFTKLNMEGFNTPTSTITYSKCEVNYNNFTFHDLLNPLTENYHPYTDHTNEFFKTNYISLEETAVDNYTKHSLECKRWVYDTSEFKTTFVMDDNLVCSKKFHRTHAIVAFMGGFTVGSFGIGLISDRLGRKIALMISIVLYIISNIALSFVNEFNGFTALRFFSGFSVGGLLSTCYVMDLELVSQDHTMLAGMVFMLFWGFGALLLTGMAYLIRDWRSLNLYLALPTILFLLYIKFVPESTRWLVAKGKLDEARNILRKIARKNKRTFKEPILPDEKKKASVAIHGTFHAYKKLCCHRSLVCRTAVILFNWFVVALVFLGLSWNVNYLEGDVFLNFFLTSFAEVVGFFVCTILLRFFGRKPVYGISLFAGGLALMLTIIPILYGSSDLYFMMLLLSLVGKVGSSAAFATIFLYSAEFFPTVIRNSGLGIANFCARTGGMIAPFVPDSSHLLSGELGKVLPMIIFGGLAVIAGALSVILPETKNNKLPETIEDLVDLSKGRNKQFEEIIVVPPANGQMQHGQEMEMMHSVNGQKPQSEESDMLQPLNEQEENNGDLGMQ